MNYLLGMLQAAYEKANKDAAVAPALITHRLTSQPPQNDLPTLRTMQANRREAEYIAEQLHELIARLNGFNSADDSIETDGQ